ncbi:MAG: hypothetical protein PHR15_01500 [Atopobiaceae bacterium]|jgi:hypothetical protein|nr:hypothetical protein [Atopobiaceae bacterium]MCH4215019.1 hypothetical protein [Atopobiaceae bacterium]MCH4229872.1 hypothetical protein [Atopobiaceae bacterium]MCH4277001.1 hypothetical protein [Atopobiaceae bacterium]MCI1226113.1 hypothetical protein [Atopobiaceae bacterium]
MTTVIIFVGIVVFVAIIALLFKGDANEQRHRTPADDARERQENINATGNPESIDETMATWSHTFHDK